MGAINFFFLKWRNLSNWPCHIFRCQMLFKIINCKESFLSLLSFINSFNLTPKDFKTHTGKTLISFRLLAIYFEHANFRSQFSIETISQTLYEALFIPHNRNLNWTVYKIKLLQTLPLLNQQHWASAANANVWTLLCPMDVLYYISSPTVKLLFK